VAALRRFNDNLASLPAESWGACTFSDMLLGVLVGGLGTRAHGWALLLGRGRGADKAARALPVATSRPNTAPDALVELHPFLRCTPGIVMCKPCSQQPSQPCLLPLPAALPLPTRAFAEAKLRPVMHELAYNLESFNPAFTAVLLKVGRCVQAASRSACIRMG